MNREVFFQGDHKSKIKFRQKKLDSLYNSQNGGGTQNDNPRAGDGLMFKVLCETFFLSTSYYSAGQSIEVLRLGYYKAMLQVLRDFRSSHQFRPLDPMKFDEYQIMLGIISLAICFDLEKSIFERSVVRTVSPVPCDRLVEALIAKYLGREADDDLPIHHAYPYQALWEATQDWCKDPSERVNHFFNNYYDGLKQAPWYDLHVKHSPDFFGYWSFESAAVIKLWKIDDRTFADSMFYPRDLIYERMFRTWEDSAEGERDWDDLEKYRATEA
jgi:hypothetical protein